MPQTESAGGDAIGLKWQSPLALYVVFDDACAESRKLASHLFRWFRLHSDDGSSLELGLPIWYRCTHPVDGLGNSTTASCHRFNGKTRS